jgi:hypothetical protein
VIQAIGHLGQIGGGPNWLSLKRLRCGRDFDASVGRPEQRAPQQIFLGPNNMVIAHATLATEFGFTPLMQIREYTYQLLRRFEIARGAGLTKHVLNRVVDTPPI